MVDNDIPGAWPVWTPGVPMAALIEYYTLVYTTYESSGPYGLGEDFFYAFPMAPGAGPVWTPGARLAEFIAQFIKRTTIHCYTQI